MSSVVNNNAVEILQPPALEIDAFMLKKYGQAVGPQQKRERRGVWNLLSYLEARGFKTIAVFDGDNLHTVSDAKAAMELIFNLDECCINFGMRDQAIHVLEIVLGEDLTEMIVDWTSSPGDADGFDAVMEAFNMDNYA